MYRIIVISHCRPPTMRQYDNTTVCIYRILVLSHCRARQCDSARLSYYRIVGGDNAITRLYDRVGAMASLSQHTAANRTQHTLNTRRTVFMIRPFSFHTKIGRLFGLYYISICTTARPLWAPIENRFHFSIVTFVRFE